MSAEASEFVVLLVDDDVRTTRRLAEMLREDGLTVETARDGAAAISRLAKTPAPDALVTELTTPHANGAVIGQFARSRRAGLPVFVVTGYPNLFSPEAFGDPQAMLFTKPLDYGSLKEALLAARQFKNGPTQEAPGSLERANGEVELESRTKDGRGNSVPGAQALRAVR